MSPKNPRLTRAPVRRARAAVVPSRRLRAAAPKPAPRPADEAEALIRDIAARKARIADDFYEIGVALNELSDRRLYHALGYDSLDDLLAKRRVIGRAQAFKLMSVAHAYPKKLALRLGVEKAYALVRYAAVTPQHDVARVLAASNVKLAGKALKHLTVAELRDETKRLASGPAPSDAATKEAKKKARAVQRALRAEGAKSAKVRAERHGAGFELTIRVALEDADALMD